MDDIVTAGRRRRRWVLAQRTGAVAAAAVAAVTGLLLVGGSMLTGTVAGRTGHGGGQQIAAPPAAQNVPELPPFTFTFTGYGAGGLRILPPSEITTTYQRASIVAGAPATAGKKTTTYLGSVTVYRHGLRPPGPFQTGTELTIQGRKAYQSAVQSTGHGAIQSTYDGPVFIPESPNTGPKWTMYTLTWQYEDNSWAVITSQPTDLTRVLSAAEEVSVANGLRTAALVPARVPFKVGYLPAGWQLDSILGQSFAAEDTGIVLVTYTKPDPTGAEAVPPRDYGTVRPVESVQIAIGQIDAPPPDAPKKKSTCSTTESACSWDIPGTGFYLVVSDPTNTLTTQELLKIGQGLVFDNLNRPDTWHPVG